MQVLEFNNRLLHTSSPGGYSTIYDPPHVYFILSFSFLVLKPVLHYAFALCSVGN